MALTLTQFGVDSHRGNKKYTTWDVVTSGTYPTGGEIVTALSVRIGVIEEVILPPVTAGGFYPIQPIINAAGSQVNLVFLELSAGAAGTPALQEKTNAEAYVASSTFRVTFVGVAG